jgi:catechol 2,3-dioxygenase-like lactoylglutathione lyase family enzyme
MSINKIKHVSILVNDIDAAASKIESVLGISRKENSLKTIDLGQTISIPTKNANIQLIAPSPGESDAAVLLSTRGEGLYDICMATDSLASLQKHIESSGAKSSIRQNEIYNKKSILMDPDSTGGTRLSIIEEPETDPDPNIEISLHHVTLRTENMKKDLKLWSDLFKMPIKRTAVSESYEMDTGWLDTKNSEVEFAEQLNSTGPVAKAIKIFGSGLHAIVIENDDSSVIAKRAEDKNIRVIVDNGDPVLTALHPLDFVGTLVLLTDENANHAGEI